MRTLIRSFVLSLLFVTATLAQSFTMNEGFLRGMIQQNTIQPTLRIRMVAHGPLHSLETDCEMHVAGTVQNVAIGNPPAIVVEFPNWCKFNPQGNLGDNFATLKQKWNTFATSNVDNKTAM